MMSQLFSGANAVKPSIRLLIVVAPRSATRMSCSRPALPCAGVNNADSYEQLCEFVRVVSERSPVRHFVVHCRKALLNYSPADNRKVPPLRRAWAYALARDFPHLTFSLNGQASTDAPAEYDLHKLCMGIQGSACLAGSVTRHRRCP